MNLSQQIVALIDQGLSNDEIFARLGARRSYIRAVRYRHLNKAEVDENRRRYNRERWHNDPDYRQRRLDAQRQARARKRKERQCEASKSRNR